MELIEGEQKKKKLKIPAGELDFAQAVKQHGYTRARY